MESGLVRRRVEVKYRVGSSTADAMVETLRTAEFPPDVIRRNAWVRTVYLDKPDGHLLRIARTDPSRAVKLRLREYLNGDGELRSSVVWVELKEREGAWSRKHRFPLHAARVQEFLDGRLDVAGILRDHPADPEEVAATVRRIRELAPCAISPVGDVRYERFSVEGGSPRIRFTVDRNIAYHVGPLEAVPAQGIERVPAGYREQGAVVEVKHAGGPLPEWCGAILGRRRPTEYSKFGAISRLLPSEARE